jgi:UDP-GlcNAc:undecaprenyl-phosphate GlcNAc-1-phosphate transferase
MEQYSSFLEPLMAFLATILAIVVLKPLSNKVGLLDIPGGRKDHAQATPLVGGIAIYIGLLAGILMLPQGTWMAYGSFLAGGFLIMAVGVLDDMHDISARIRLLAQLVALAIMVFWGEVQLNHLGPLFGKGPLGLGWLGIPLTLFGAATVINSINMMDGIDGLAGSISVLMLTSLFGIAYVSGLPLEAYILGIVIVALLAFLCFNFPFWAGRKAVVFMGDAGSTLIGFIIAWFTIYLSQQPQSIATPAIMLWIVAVPIMDLAVVFLKRLRQGRSPFKPGNEHLYCVLLSKGLSRVQATWVIIGLTVLTQCVAWGMIRNQWPDSAVLSTFLISFFVYLMVDMRQSRA